MKSNKKPKAPKKPARGCLASGKRLQTGDPGQTVNVNRHGVATNLDECTRLENLRD
jgi:hypothetical protein